MIGIVTPVDTLVRFHYYTVYTDYFLDEHDMDAVTITAILKLSGASTYATSSPETPGDQS